MKTSLRSILLLLAYSNVLIALEAAGFAAAALALAGGGLQPAALLLAFCSVFFVYTYDKLASFDPQDSLNDPLRSRFLQRWRRPLLAAAAVALAVGLAIAAAAGWPVLLLYLSPILLGLVYALPLLPLGFRYRRLKDVTGVKSLIVAVAWAMGAALAPLAAAGALNSAVALLAAAWVGGRLLICTIYFDLGDMRGDRRQGVRTLPVLLGFQRTRVLLTGINTVTGIGLLAGAVTGILPPVAYWLNLVTLYGFYYLAAAHSEEVDFSFFCDVVADAEGLVAGAITLFALAL